MSNPYTELKNIKYKNMLLSNNKEINKNNTQTTINDFLDRERANNKKETWNRLDKTIKLKKLQEYCIRYGKENNLAQAKIESLSQYLKNCLDRKRFERVKDINYDKENEIIKSIPNLSYNKQSKRFTLKRSEKRVSTLKSLGPSRKRNPTNKTKKITIESEN
jgi:hypothetical protein